MSALSDRGCVPGWMREAGSLATRIAGELVPCQGQLEEPLPVRTFGLRSALHCELGFMLRIVLGAHEADPNRPSGQARGNFVRMIAG